MINSKLFKQKLDFCYFMGRIKTQFVKSTSRKLLLKHPEKFSIDYKSNRAALTDMISTPSKKMKNVIAGYLSRLVRIEQKKN